MHRRAASVLLLSVMLLSTLSPAVPAAGPLQGGDADGAASASRQSPLGAEDAGVAYAILTTDSFRAAFQPLASWKTEKGLYAKVYTTDWVRNNYAGRDSREQYHAFLMDLYNHTGEGLQYVLLGGDDEVIRARELWTGIKVGWDRWSGAWVYSDQYYAGLDHDWDANGNGAFGELGEDDWDADVILGRLPVSTASEAAAVVAKVLAYERSPEVGDWMRRAVLAASVMNPPNANETNVDPENLTHAYQWYEDNAWETLQRTLPIIPSYMDKVIMYDYNQIDGGNYTPENDTLNQTAYIAAMDNGAAIVVSTTHGYIPSGRGIPHYTGQGIDFTWKDLFNESNIDDLTNGNMTPLIFFSSCYVGNFTEFDDTNFERLVTRTNGGAIAIVAPTENTYRGEEILNQSDGNWWMSETFWSHILGDMPRPGDALFQMKRDFVQHLKDLSANIDSPYFRQNLAAYNLLGEPETPVWLDTPRTMNLTLPTYVYDLDYTVTARVTSGGAGVAGARVCMMGEDFYASALTNATGHALLSISPQREGQSVKVTATAPQHRYVQQSIGITPAPAELLVVPNTLRTAKARPEAGKPVQVSADVRNIGHTASPSFSVQFYDGDPAQGGVAIGDAVDLEPLPEGTTAPVVTTWTAPTAGWHELHVVVDSGDEVAEILEDNNEGVANVLVSALDVAATGVAIRDGDGALPVGTTSTVEVEVSNQGSAELPTLRVALYLGDPAASGVLLGEATTGAPIAPSGTGEVVFTYTPVDKGTFKLVAVADPADELAEFDETDNKASLTVKVAHPPYWDAIPPVILVEDSEKQFELRRYVHDNDTLVDNITLAVVSISTDRAHVQVAGLVVTVTPDTDWSGDFQVVLHASDGDFEVPVTFDVSVGMRNDAPRFRNTVDRATINEGETWRFALDAYDPDGDPVSFTDNSEFFDVAADGNVEWTPTWEQIRQAPIHVVRFIATDGSAQTYYAMTLTLVANDTPPVLELPKRLVASADEEFVYTVTATDREGAALTYSVDFGEEEELFAIIPSTGQFAFVPSKGMRGEHNITFKVSDGTHTVEDWVIIEVLAPEEYADWEARNYVVLALELAIIVVGILYIPYYRRRQRREAAAREEAAREAMGPPGKDD